MTEEYNISGIGRWGKYNMLLYSDIDNIGCKIFISLIIYCLRHISNIKTYKTTFYMQACLYSQKKVFCRILLLSEKKVYIFNILKHNYSCLSSFGEIFTNQTNCCMCLTTLPDLACLVLNWLFPCVLYSG